MLIHLWFTSAQEQFQGDKNAKNMILLNHVKEEYEAKLAEQASENQSGKNVENQTTIPNVSVDSDFAPCVSTDIGL